MYIISGAIAIIVPIALAVYANRRFKVSWNSILYGALAFFVTFLIFQFALTQISTYLANSSYSWIDEGWFQIGFFVGISLLTGIIEAGTIWLAFKLSGEKSPSWKQGLGVGLGHGGMEILYLYGIQFVTNAIQAIDLQKNGIASLNLSAADATAAQQWLDNFASTPWHIPLTICIGVLFLLIIQVSAAMLLWLFFRKRGVKWFFATIGLQTLAFIVLIFSIFEFFQPWMVTVFFILIAAISAYILYLVKTRIIDQYPELLVAPAVPEKTSDKPVVDGKAEFLPSAPLTTREPKAEKVLTKKSTSKKPAAKKN